MRTKEQYIQGLSKMKRNLYFDGQLIDRTDEVPDGLSQHHRHHL